jgi:putative transposase
VIAGATYFFTVVTFRRRRFLIEPQSRQILREAIKEVRQRYPFTIEAWVLLPDHLHCLWIFPPDGEPDFSIRWGLIKAKFSRRTKELFHQADGRTASRAKHRETTIWQRRFWEHLVHDYADFERHFNYIHYNPVKHGLVSMVRDWPYSKFHRCVKEGICPEDWGGNISFDTDDAFGE